MSDIFGNENEINFENSHLVIFFDEEKRFSHFQWYEKDIVDVSVALNKFNAAASDASAEICTDELVREICARQKKTWPFYDVIDRYQDAQRNIGAARRILDKVLDDLNSIYDSNWGAIDG